MDFELATALRGDLLRHGKIDWYVASDKDERMNVVSGRDLALITAGLAAYPFRCKPVYLEGVWGGYYIQHARKLPEQFKNIAWIFDLIPMEVSILIQLGGGLMEIIRMNFLKKFGSPSGSIQRWIMRIM